VFEGTFVFQGQEGLDQPVISMLTDLETLAAFIALPTAEDRRDFELLEKEFEGLDDDDGSSADIEAAWFAADDDATGDADAAPVNVAPSPDDGLSDPAPETAPSPTVNARAVSDRVAPVMGLAVVAAPSTSLSALRDTLSAALGPTYRVARLAIVSRPLGHGRRRISGGLLRRAGDAVCRRCAHREQPLVDRLGRPHP
jgi:hypothetical protein